MLISPAYKEQNRLLHLQRPDYGANGWRLANSIKGFMREWGCSTVLDYGCGKGSLAKALNCQGYDPAIPEFAERPIPSDLVACTDVLEHIEPECLDAVLDDIRSLSTKAVYLLVSCRPAAKKLPDGRNTHLIIQTPKWWRGQLLRYFDEIAFKIGKDSEIKFRGSPRKEVLAEAPEMGEMYSPHGTPFFTKTVKTFVGVSESIDNIKHSCARGLPQVKIEAAHARRAALCCFGPSLKDAVPRLLSETADVFTVSGAHDFLIGQGITPYGHIEADAQKHKAQFSTKPQPGIKYLLASRCHPDVFEGKEDVTIWHMHHGNPENGEVKAFYPDAVFVNGSVSVAGRGLALLMTLGYREFVIYGMDCSFPYDESKKLEEQLQHASNHPNPQAVVRHDPVNGRVFYTTLQLMLTRDHFLEVVGMIDKYPINGRPAAQFELVGESLLSECAKAKGLSNVRFT